MSFTTLVRASLRSILLGSAALCFTAALNLPPAFGPGGSGTAFAQGTSSHGHGGAGGYRGGAGSRGGASGTHGSGEHGASGGEDDACGGTHGGESSHGGESTHGGDSTHDEGGGAAGPSGAGGSTAGHGHYGDSAGGAADNEGGSKGRGRGGGSTGNAGRGRAGGQPVWAKEGIPEVELGRLSVARAPASVLKHAFDEIVANWTTMSSAPITLSDGRVLTVEQLYSLPAAEFAQIVQTNYDAIVRIDSPLENLGLLKDLATNNKTVLTGVAPASNTDLAAIFLGSASDKTIPVTPDTVTALYTILGLPALTPEQTTTLATEADAVRSAINMGHGD